MKTLQFIFLCNKGGVGKSTLAVLFYQVLLALRRQPTPWEVERPAGRKFKEALDHLGKAEGIQFVPLKDIPDHSNDPGLFGRAFGELLDALAHPENGDVVGDLVVDVAADGTTNLLKAGKLSRHGSISDGGSSLVFCIVTKMDDGASLKFAEEAKATVREVWPSAKIICVTNFVTGNRISPAEQALAYDMDGLLQIDALQSEVLNKLWGGEFYPPQFIVNMTPKEVMENMAPETPMKLSQAAIELGRVTEWHTGNVERITDLVRDLLGEGGTDEQATGPTVSPSKRRAA